MGKINCLRCRHFVYASDSFEVGYCGIEKMVVKHPHLIVLGVNNIIEDCPYYEKRRDEELEILSSSKR